MINLILISIGKALSAVSQALNLGNGSTWPGHVALRLNNHFISEILKNSKATIILIAGTNGKTTTSLLLKTILETTGKKVILNDSGANLINGLASMLLLRASVSGKLNADYIIFESDENTLVPILTEVDPHYIVLLNLFRDQLDRYGEVASIARKWVQALKNEDSIQLILNADDPEVAFIGQQLFNAKRMKYFGLNQAGETKLEHAVDSIYCPRCGTKLTYRHVYYSHLGDWSCSHCNLKRPQLALDEIPFHPLVGLYNDYNTLAAVLVAKELEIQDSAILTGLMNFLPAFGRQEIIHYQNKIIQFFLSKNPIGFNQSLDAIKHLHGKNILIALNDNFADGTDISWIWDIDTDALVEFPEQIIITGTRGYDMGLRLKYSSKHQKLRKTNQNETSNFTIIHSIEQAVEKSLELLPANETLYILPTYTAMLVIRKVLTGKKIL